MEEYDNYKEFNSDKSIDELRFNLTFYKSRLELLNEEFEFFKHLLNSNIYNPKTPNLLETFELFKKRIEKKTTKRSKKDWTQSQSFMSINIELLGIN